MTLPDSISLSTSSVYPESTTAGFETAARLGFDGVEVMVGIDDTSANIDDVLALSKRHGMPVVAIHAPCLLITQRVWGTEHWSKLRTSAQMAQAVGAEVVVVHPPFRWQRDYASRFVEGIAELEEETGIVYAVENMYPWRTGKRRFQAYSPGWDPVEQDYTNLTLDLSHCATAREDSVEMAARMGERLAHVHVTDGSGSGRDEHLIPGRGNQNADKVLEWLAENGYAGHVVVEINTRKCDDRESRDAALLESLAFCRLYSGT